MAFYQAILLTLAKSYSCISNEISDGYLFYLRPKQGLRKIPAQNKRVSFLAWINQLSFETFS